MAGDGRVAALTVWSLADFHRSASATTRSVEEVSMNERACGEYWWHTLEILRVRSWDVDTATIWLYRPASHIQHGSISFDLKESTRGEGENRTPIVFGVKTMVNPV